MAKSLKGETPAIGPAPGRGMVLCGKAPLNSMDMESGISQQPGDVNTKNMKQDQTYFNEY